MKNETKIKQQRESDSESFSGSDTSDLSSESFGEVVTKKTKKAEKYSFMRGLFIFLEILFTSFNFQLS